MSSGQGKVKIKFNKTQIRDGKIVVLRKNGTVKVYKDRKTGEKQMVGVDTLTPSFFQIYLK
jgi:hypothetical protein